MVSPRDAFDVRVAEATGRRVLDKSDLSGTPLEGDAATTVFLRVDDQRRRLAVTAQEAATLAEAGTNVSRFRDRVWYVARRRGGRALIWGLGLLVASLAIPAATKQWSDRKAETDIKVALFELVSNASVHALNAGESLGRAPAPAVQKKALDEYRSIESRIDARVAVYFDNSRVDAHWAGYRSALFDYIVLGCCGTRRAQTLRVSRLHRYFDRHRLSDSSHPPPSKDPWRALACAADNRCTNTVPFASLYQWVGLTLLEDQWAILKELRAAHTAGLSRGWGDFVHDTFSPVTP